MNFSCTVVSQSSLRTKSMERKSSRHRTVQAPIHLVRNDRLVSVDRGVLTPNNRRSESITQMLLIIYHPASNGAINIRALRLLWVFSRKAEVLTRMGTVLPIQSPFLHLRSAPIRQRAQQHMQKEKRTTFFAISISLLVIDVAQLTIP